ncbi:MAG TPA: glycosyltransferase [Candidatus Dojkabacteria bacterium]|nr:glycosyltransferase [Candidatus Dojkabacteria bacterium]
MDKPDTRPEGFNKLMCLKNFLHSLSKVKDYKFTLVFDGEIDNEFELLAKKHGDIDIVNRIGNSGSCWYTFEKAIKENQDEDIIYFVEDDYIHTEDALVKLVEAFEKIEDADYITLFDHPVRYIDEYHYGLDIPHYNQEIFITSNHHWRTQESTCMTFATKVKTLKEDKEHFDLYVRQRPVPEDRELFKRLQGLAGYEKRSPFRLLLGPMPSLCTHCHKLWMAPIIDWNKVLKETQDV